MESLIEAYIKVKYKETYDSINITPFLQSDEQHYRVVGYMSCGWDSDEFTVSLSDLLGFMWENK